MRVTRGNADASSRHPPWAPIRIRRKSMLERLLNKITDDGSAELVYLILGSILLFAFQRLRAAYRQMRHRHFIKHQLAAYKERKREIGRAACRERVCRTCRYRWAADQNKKNKT